MKDKDIISIVFQAITDAVMETLIIIVAVLLIMAGFAALFWNFAPEQWHEWFNNAAGYRGG